ncbi:alpha/beta hydrolase [Methylobacillus gramineus]|uniref:alpha/beta hydrolase family protein n=1 Tax=Methylobacillus gramineus TaxID=755169 RepID=UPI001CFFF342|nr:alpha/beta fold hydrolase [Methylobacillus gramineus]MCB5185704.1 alpha/beta hydrolase [Methylobacillus gramineus]
MFVGTRQFQFTDHEAGVSFPVLVMYPTAQPAVSTAFGPYVMDVSPDAPVAQGVYPLVIVSHGSGGSHLLYRSITMHLARNGYIVAMLEHAGNNRLDNQFQGKIQNLQYRPRHVTLTIDGILADPELSRHSQQHHVAIIGHSMGGYTALAIAGGQPWYPPDQLQPEQLHTAQQVEVEHDPRVGVLVLLAPATPWYMPEGALSRVDLPILMLTAEHDPYTPQWHADIVLNGVPDREKVTFREVKNAGHFSFLSPFPPKIQSGGSLPTIDPEGFDREQFHEQLKVELLAYLNLKLKTT